MHVRLFAGQLKPGTREEAVQRFTSEGLTPLQGLQNYGACRILINDDDEIRALLGFTGECGPGLLRQLYEEVYGKIADLLQDEHLEHSRWDEIIVDEGNAAPDD